MNKTTDYIEEVGIIASELEKLGVMPILVGGMALVILGSRRVTRDFDFLISIKDIETKELIKVFYKRGFELASKVDDNGDIVRTIDNQKIAAMRLSEDKPSSVYLLNRKTGLRIDLLFDFPFPASEIASNALKKKIRSYTFYIASTEDLLRLKKAAFKDRSTSADAQDIEFLKKL